MKSANFKEKSCKNTGIFKCAFLFCLIMAMMGIYTSSAIAIFKESLDPQQTINKVSAHREQSKEDMQEEALSKEKQKLLPEQVKIKSQASAAGSGLPALGGRGNKDIFLGTLSIAIAIIASIILLMRKRKEERKKRV